MLYLADDKSVTESIRVIQEFSKAAGAQINKYESMYKYLGRWAGRREAICEYQLCAGPMEVLGISFGNTEGDAIFNWGKILKKMRIKLGLWNKRKLTILGKVLVIKADILPGLLHLAYIFPIPCVLRKKFI